MSQQIPDGLNLLDAMTAAGAGVMKSKGVMPRGPRIASQEGEEAVSDPDEATTEAPRRDLSTEELLEQVQKHSDQRKSRAAGEPEFVPMEAHKGRIARLAKKNEALARERDELKRQLEERNKAPTEDELVKSLAAEQKPKDWETLSPDEQLAWLAVQAAKRVSTQVVNPTSEQVRALERRLKDTEMFRGLSDEQMAVIDDIRQIHPTLADRPQQLLAIAKMEEPALFRDMGSSGTPYVARPGRGSEEEMRQHGPPTSKEIVDFLASLPPDDPRARDLGPWLIKANMEERFPGIHGNKG